MISQSLRREGEKERGETEEKGEKKGKHESVVSTTTLNSHASPV